MSHQSKRAGRRFSEWYLAVLLLIGGLAIGAILIALAEEVAEPDTFREALLRDGGLAFLIAALIGSSYEVLQRLHLMRQTEDAIEKIRQEQIIDTLRTMMSPAVYDEVHDHIIRRPIVRPRHSVTLAFDWLDRNGGQYLTSSSTSEYQLRNLTEGPMAEEIVAYCARYLKDEFPDGYAITSVCFDCGDGPQRREGSTLNVERTEDMLEYREQIICRPGKLAEVTVVHRGVHRSHDQLLLVLQQATEEFELTITFPRGLEVNAWANHPCASESFRLVMDQQSVKRWRLGAASLPFQSVQVGWERAKADSTEGGASPNAGRYGRG